MNSLYPEVDGTSLTYSSVLVELYTYTSSIEPFYFKGQGNKRRISLIDHISTSTEDSLYTSMEALNNSSFGAGGQNRRNQNRVKVLPDLEPTKPSRTNPNVVFERPSSMSSLMY